MKKLNISDLNQKDFNKIIQYADELKNKIEPVLIEKNIGLIFEKTQPELDCHFKLVLMN